MLWRMPADLQRRSIGMLTNIASPASLFRLRPASFCAMRSAGMPEGASSASTDSIAGARMVAKCPHCALEFAREFLRTMVRRNSWFAPTTAYRLRKLRKRIGAREAAHGISARHGAQKPPVGSRDCYIACGNCGNSAACRPLLWCERIILRVMLAVQSLAAQLWEESSMPMVRLAAVAALAVSVALPAAGQGIPKAQSPEEVGFLSTRLKRLSDRIEEGVKNNELPGAVVLIARNGRIAMFDSFGYRDKEAKVAMTNDTIFRIASMTKPIVTVAAMILVEEGKLSVADRVSQYIPAFADTKVAVQKKKEDGTVEIALEPQSRPMTIQDLMRHTSGLTNPAPGTNPVKQSYIDMKVADRGQTLAEMADRLAKLALLYQPGTTWEYSMSTDLLGRVIEIASGQPLDKFIDERITKPLKMGDTAFEVGPDKKARGARPMKEGPKNELPSIPDVTEKLTLRSGGGGMVSTAADY